MLRATASPLYDAQGKITAVVASARDVTELKRMEQQLLQSEKLASIGQMLAGVAHELNNPLTAILGVTEYMRENTVEEGEKRKIELAYQQAKRAMHIVKDLLAFSRPPVPRSRRVDLRAVVKHTLELEAESLRKNAIQVEFEAPKRLPVVMADASQLTEVILNLLNNAEQAILEARRTRKDGAGRGRIRLTVKVSSENGAGSATSGRRMPGRDTTNVSVAVQDDGIGLDPQLLPKIFDPFFTTKRPGGGTGLGLSICLAIVREHGGKLEAEPLDPPGSGSVFRMTLPAAEL